MSKIGAGWRSNSKYGGYARATTVTEVSECPEWYCGCHAYAQEVKNRMATKAKNLTSNNTYIVDNNGGRLLYHASSPEQAIECYIDDCVDDTFDSLIVYKVVEEQAFIRKEIWVPKE